jgi:hypothetical protein
MTDSDHPHRAFIEAVRAAASIDPTPTVRQLARNVGLTPEEIIHYVLVQWATSGSEALMATGPLALRQLQVAAESGDMEKVRGMIAWLMSGYE